MDLWDLFRVLMRRWWVTVPLLALTVVAALTLGGRQTTTYTGTASYLLVPPGNDGTNGLPVVNPLTGLPGTGQFGALLGSVVGSSETRDQIEGSGGSRDYSLTQGRGVPGLVVKVQADTAEQAKLTVQAVLDQVARQVPALQSQISVPAQFRVTGKVVVRPSVTSTSASSTRVLLAVLAAGLLITALAALAAEALLSLRRRRVSSPVGVRARALTSRDGDDTGAIQDGRPRSSDVDLGRGLPAQP